MTGTLHACSYYQVGGSKHYHSFWFVWPPLSLVNFAFASFVCRVAFLQARTWAGNLQCCVKHA